MVVTRNQAKRNNARTKEKKKKEQKKEQKREQKKEKKKVERKKKEKKQLSRAERGLLPIPTRTNYQLPPGKDIYGSTQLGKAGGHLRKSRTGKLYYYKYKPRYFQNVEKKGKWHKNADHITIRNQEIRTNRGFGIAPKGAPRER